MRSLIVLAVAVCVGRVASATEQIPATVVFGGRVYAISEVPMLGLWDYGPGFVGGGKVKPPHFEVRSSANWAGYTAQFEIRDSKFYLKRIIGRIDGKKRKNEEIIAGKEFPLVADWYSGRIHLNVGDFDVEAGESTAVIIFHVEKGVITKTEFAERMKPIWTWNGLPPSEPRGKSRAEPSHPPEPPAEPNSDDK